MCGRQNFSRAVLTNVNFARAEFGWTILTGIDLSLIHGLESINHHGPSYVDMLTIYKIKGNAPDTFLQGVGFPNDVIDLIISLEVQPIQFYSCFISHSSKDREFAERLYADLQSNGVLCLVCATSHGDWCADTE